jgi:hypothetical protein
MVIPSASPNFDPLATSKHITSLPCIATSSQPCRCLLYLRTTLRTTVGSNKCRSRSPWRIYRTQPLDVLLLGSVILRVIEHKLVYVARKALYWQTMFRWQSQLPLGVWKSQPKLHTPVSQLHNHHSRLPLP